MIGLYKYRFLNAFKHRNYCLFFGGQFVSLIGMWVQMTAQGWLVYRITDSALLLGLATFTNQISIVLFGPWGGVLADRYSKKLIFALALMAGSVLSFILTIHVLFFELSIGLFLFLIALLGVALAIENPTRQSLMVEIVGTKDLVNSIALNALMFNIARMLGPIIAATLILYFNEGICFLLNSISFLPIIIMLGLMKPTKHSIAAKTKYKKQGLFDGFISGLKFVFDLPSISQTLRLVMIMGIFAMPFQTFLPIYASKVFSQGIISLGWLSGIFGFGSFSAAVMLVLRSRIGNAEHRIAFFALLFGISVMVFAISTNLFFSLFILFIAGFAMISALISVNSLLQVSSPDNIRGRVMSFYAMCNIGMIPIGSLLLGFLADILDKSWVLLASASITVLFSALYYKNASRFRRLRLNSSM